MHCLAASLNPFTSKNYQAVERDVSMNASIEPIIHMAHNLLGDMPNQNVFKALETQILDARSSMCECF